MNLLDDKTKYRNPKSVADFIMGFILTLALCLVALVSTMSFAHGSERCEIKSLPANVGEISSRSKVVYFGDFNVTLIGTPMRDHSSTAIEEAALKVGRDYNSKANGTTPDFNPLRIHVRGEPDPTGTYPLSYYSQDRDYLRSLMTGNEDNFTFAMLKGNSWGETSLSNLRAGRSRIREALNGVKSVPIENLTLAHSGPVLLAKEKHPNRVNLLYLEMNSTGDIKALEARKIMIQEYFARQSFTTDGNEDASKYKFWRVWNRAFPNWNRETETAYNDSNTSSIDRFSAEQLENDIQNKLGRALTADEREFITMSANEKLIPIEILKLQDKKSARTMSDEAIGGNDIIAFADPQRLDSLSQLVQSHCREWYNETSSRTQPTVEYRLRNDTDDSNADM